ncbi:hypothetical protein ACFQMM_02390 [Saliphagus sp. GCM10025308]
MTLEMTDTVSLPFGQTDLNPKEAADLIDIDRAVELAAEGGVTDPEARVGEFVAAIPGLVDWQKIRAGTCRGAVPRIRGKST